jgi:hypothetical protein
MAPCMTSEEALTALLAFALLKAGARWLRDFPQCLRRVHAPVQRQRPKSQRLRHPKVHSALLVLNHHTAFLALQPQHWEDLCKQWFGS